MQKRGSKGEEQATTKADQSGDISLLKNDGSV